MNGLKITREFLDFMSDLSKRTVRTSPDQEMMMLLMHCYLSRTFTNVKQLESHYSGSRTSFQSLIGRLKDTGVIVLRFQPKDKRCRIVELSQESKQQVDKCLQSFLSACEPVYPLPLDNQTPYDMVIYQYDLIDKNLAGMGSDGSGFLAVLDVWGKSRGWRLVPSFTTREMLSLSEIVNMEYVHIARPTAGQPDDFRFIWMGGAGKKEQSLMSSDLLSSLPDDMYRDYVLAPYKETVRTATPRLDRVCVTTPLFTEDYYRLLLPYSEEIGTIDTVISIVASAQEPLGLMRAR